MQDKYCYKSQRYDNGCDGANDSTEAFFLFIAELIGAEFVLDNFVVIRCFQVGKFRTLGPAGFLVAPAVRAERGVVFNFGMAVRAEHARNITKTARRLPSGL